MIARLRGRVREEHGQSYVEWLGGTAVMVLIVLAVFAAKPSLGDQLRCQAGAQIDRILSIDQEGACNRAKPRADPRAARRAAQDRADRNATGAPPGR
jgi:hypothetical protein